MSEVREIDARGLRCPLPVLRLRRVAADLPAGALVRLLADDPAAAVDVPAFVRERGWSIVSAERGPPLAWTIRLAAG